ncbi:MAG: hypothetical protein WDN28_20470 [Chthoniobacter sp.]
MKPVNRPTGGILPAPRPCSICPTAAYDESQPAKYLVSGDLHAFRVAPWPGNGNGALMIMVNGNLDISAARSAFRRM